MRVVGFSIALLAGLLVGCATVDYTTATRPEDCGQIPTSLRWSRGLTGFGGGLPAIAQWDQINGPAIHQNIDACLARFEGTDEARKRLRQAYEDRQGNLRSMPAPTQTAPSTLIVPPINPNGCTTIMEAGQMRTICCSGGICNVY